jgi:nucleoside-diphosphate-sugar epimerase
MDDRPVLLLGCGYTAARAARGLLARGRRVLATTRDPAALADLAAAGAEVLALDLADPAAVASFAPRVPPGALVLSSVPSLPGPAGPRDPGPAIRAALGDRPARVVLLSTTGVYGDAAEVDERTPPAPRTPRQIARRETEVSVAAGPWSTLVLRPAAIYGPGRGLLEMLRAGRYRIPGDGENHVSRIHADDLAALSLAGFDSDLTGAFPVADDRSGTVREVVAFAADLLGVPMPPSVPSKSLHETLRGDRRVDGRAVRGLLRVTLRYPDYRTGFPACLAG